LYFFDFSLYSITFSILFSSPFNSSDTSILSSFERGINKDISGVPLPVSHLETAFSVTNNLFAIQFESFQDSFFFS